MSCTVLLLMSDHYHHRPEICGLHLILSIFIQFICIIARVEVDGCVAWSCSSSLGRSFVSWLAGLLHVRVVTCSKLRDYVVLATELAK